MFTNIYIYVYICMYNCLISKNRLTLYCMYNNHVPLNMAAMLDHFSLLLSEDTNPSCPDVHTQRLLLILFS